MQEVYDNTNHEDDRGTLVAFVSDEKADAMFELSVEERKATILASLARYLGPKAEEPVVYYESDWGSEEWTRGAYAASFDLGGLHRYGADSRTPVGPIHFSCSDIAAEGGTSTSTVPFGWVSEPQRHHRSQQGLTAALPSLDHCPAVTIAGQ